MLSGSGIRVEAYQFSNVDRNLSRADTDGETVDDTADNQHGNVLSGTDKDRTNAPKRVLDQRQAR